MLPEIVVTQSRITTTGVSTDAARRPATRQQWRHEHRYGHRNRRHDQRHRRHLDVRDHRRGHRPLAGAVAAGDPRPAAGVQLQTPYGDVNGAYTSVDVRGFGAFATANTLVLINGRRLNDLDLAGVDLSTIPRDSIERIEITARQQRRGALRRQRGRRRHQHHYQDGTSGAPVAMRVEGGVGSFNQQTGEVSASVIRGRGRVRFTAT